MGRGPPRPSELGKVQKVHIKLSSPPQKEGEAFKKKPLQVQVFFDLAKKTQGSYPIWPNQVAFYTFCFTIFLELVDRGICVENLVHESEMGPHYPDPPVQSLVRDDGWAAGKEEGCTDRRTPSTPPCRCSRRSSRFRWPGSSGSEVRSSHSRSA